MITQLLILLLAWYLPAVVFGLWYLTRHQDVIRQYDVLLILTLALWGYVFILINLIPNALTKIVWKRKK
jgi:hypothetical protein